MKIVLKSRFKAFAVHFCFSLTIAILALIGIFFVWYPSVFADELGGFHLFFLLVGCDVLIGPTLTFVVFNRNKARWKLISDLVVIVVLQLCALTYGLHVVAEARPVYFVFIKDRIEAITSIEYDRDSFKGLTSETEKYRHFSWTGPRYVAVKMPEDAHERSLMLLNALQTGRDFPHYLRYYEPYDRAKEEIVKAAMPVATLAPKSIQGKKDLNAAIAESHLALSQIGWLLVKHRYGFCTALIDKKTAKVIAYLPFDPTLNLKQENASGGKKKK
jgi:hypothetical protein